MVDRISEYNRMHKLFLDDHRLLLAISGGIDSMVMLDLLKRLNKNIAVAHCNFKLRGDESDEDEVFVREYCNTHNIQFYCKQFKTEEYARKYGLSIQMAARKLRYAWFHKLLSDIGFTSIVVGHNSDDILETFFINLTRGTGLKGLTGIKPISEKIIRPLLGLSRDDINEYASKKSIKYREDSSNSDIKYKRNHIRHALTPLLNELNPGFNESLESTINRLNEAYDIFSQQIESKKSELLSREGENFLIDINGLLQLTPENTYIYEIMKEFGVGRLQIDEVKKLLLAESGKYLSTPTHTILKDRGKLIVSTSVKFEIKEIILASLEELKEIKGYTITVEEADKYTIPDNPDVACLDFDSLKFPITMRPWREGDWFRPLGLKGKKKISDLFTDLKVPVNMKSSIGIFLSAGDIIWVSGYRIDERYKTTSSTEKVLVISKDY